MTARSSAVDARGRRWRRRTSRTTLHVVALAVGALAVRIALPVAVAGVRTIDGTVNINTAPVESLSLLPGIGPAKARAILSYRVRHAFRTVDELVRVKGIGRRMVREMRAHLAVAGPTTVRALAASETVVAPQPVPAVAARPVCPSPARPVPHPAAVAAGRMPVRPARPREIRYLRSFANHCLAPP